jgi:hypothetical protein
MRVCLGESRRAFSWSTIKRLSASSSSPVYILKQIWAEITGKADFQRWQMGKGSARAVFRIGSNKVFKLARPIPRGPAQNHAEVDVYTDPGVRPVVAKILDFDDRHYLWLVSEMVQPLRGGEREWSRLAGFPLDLIEDIRWSVPGRDAWFYWRLEQYIRGDTKTFMDLGPVSPEDLVDWVKKGSPEPVGDMAAKRVFEHVTSLPIYQGVVSLINHGVETGDLIVSHHWGLTGDGRLVCLDYGFTQRVSDEHY